MNALTSESTSVLVSMTKIEELARRTDVSEQIQKREV
jgi:hypothetical protein